MEHILNVAYRNQNAEYILVAKDMPLKPYAILTCVLLLHAGWESGVHDNRILNEARTNPELDFSHPIGNQYYLVDASYAHKKRYMAPYKSSKIRYHLQDFHRANVTARELRNEKKRYNSSFGYSMMCPWADAKHQIPCIYLILTTTY